MTEKNAFKNLSEKIAASDGTPVPLGAILNELYGILGGKPPHRILSYLVKKLLPGCRERRFLIFTQRGVDSGLAVKMAIAAANATLSFGRNA